MIIPSEQDHSSNSSGEPSRSSPLGEIPPSDGDQADSCGPSSTAEVPSSEHAPEKALSVSEGESLDKSAKPRQGGGKEAAEEAREKMKKRARSKWITADLLGDLDDLDSPVPYHHAYECSKRIEQHDGSLTTRYCGSRWCIVCNRIRTARRIDRYGPVFREWDENGGVQFVTLTVPNCEGGELDDLLDEMMHQLKLCRKQIRRTRGLEYKAVRSLEVTYNEEEDTYHPHFHIAVCGRSVAIALRDEWLKRWAKASRGGQDVRRWDGRKGSLKELTKYATKLIAPGDGEGPPPEALDVIFRALHGRHVFRPVGFDLSEYGEPVDWEDVEDVEDLKESIPAWSEPEENRIWWWDGDLGDWVDPDSGECLTGWSPDEGSPRGDPDVPPEA
jgi:hypothetical protein